jgi:5-formyltetrahydrofolate cyclo-ligase
MFYVSMKEEVRTQEMIRGSLGMGKQVVVPSLKPDRRRITPSLLVDYEGDLEEGVFGIPEPRAECVRSFPVEDIEIVLVPGVAFDVCGGRLGFGGGYYDGFLAELSSGTKRWGLAFEFQVVEELPLTNRDVPVEKIIMEERVIDCKLR